MFFRWSPSGNMSWQGQSLREAFFALDPSRAVTEFDSTVIYLAYYFRFIMLFKVVELESGVSMLNYCCTLWAAHCSILF